MIATTIPRLPALPVLGNIADFRTRRLELLRRVQQECGDVGIFQVGVWPVVLANKPDDIATVLVEQSEAFEKSPLSRRYLRPLFGTGVYVTEDDLHRRHRRLMAPAFQHQRIAEYAATMGDYSEQIQQSWQDGQEVDLFQEMLRLTLWIVGRAFFHADVSREADAITATVSDMLRLGSEIANRLVPIPIHWPTPRNRRFRATLDRIDATIYQMIAEHRRADQDHGDILSMLLRTRDEADGSGLADQEVRDELVALMIAGHETTAVALAWSWYLLVKHPEVYQRLRDEVDRVLQGRTPSVEDLAKLPYTLQVFKVVAAVSPGLAGDASGATAR
jgi:cytochrome P450